MPVTRQAAQVTDGYRLRLLGLRESTVQQILKLLDAVDLDLPPSGLSRDLAQWLAKATAVARMNGAQAALLSNAYLSAFLVASGAERLTAAAAELPVDVATFARVRPALLWRLGQGAGRTVAVRTARAVATRAARDAVGNAAAQTLADSIRREPQINGWHRATSGSCCQRCADLSGARHLDSTAFRLAHPADRCTPEPTILGRAEAYKRHSPNVVSP